MALGIALALALSVLLAYGPTLRYDFVWDDHEQVVDNPSLGDWSHAKTFLVEDVLGSSRGHEESSNYYRPLFFLQYLAFSQLFGIDPVRWHALALAYHLLATLAAWVCARRLGFEPRVAGLAALFFAIHPAHGESVSWVAAAFNDPAVAVLLLVSVAFHLEARRAKTSVAWPHLICAIVAYALSLLIKESALSMLALVPLVETLIPGSSSRRPTVSGLMVLGASGMLLLLAELAGAFSGGGPWWVLTAQLGLLATATMGLEWRARRRLGEDDAGEVSAALRAYLPYLATTFVWIAIRKMAIGTGLGIYEGSISTAQWLATVPGMLWLYLRFLVWPWGFSPSYSFRYAEGFATLDFLLPMLGLALVGWLFVRLASRWPWVWFAGGWFAACLLPALNVRSFRPTYLVHQRYLYLAVFGFCLVLAWAVGTRLRGRARLLTILAIVGVWSVSLQAHNRYWSSDLALWTRIAEVDPGNAAAQDWLGAEALRQGRLATAESRFRRSIEIDSEAPTGYRNLAVLYHQGYQRPDQALDYYREALGRFHRASGSSREAMAALSGYAECLVAVGEPEQALTYFRQLAENPPYSPVAARNAAVVLHQLGRSEDLLRWLELSLKRHPEDATLRRMWRDVSQAEMEGVP